MKRQRKGERREGERSRLGTTWAKAQSRASLAPRGPSKRWARLGRGAPSLTCPDFRSSRSQWKVPQALNVCLEAGRSQWLPLPVSYCNGETPWKVLGNGRQPWRTWLLSQNSREGQK